MRANPVPVSSEESDVNPSPSQKAHGDVHSMPAPSLSCGLPSAQTWEPQEKTAVTAPSPAPR